jgi:hypothetical protein
MADKRGGYRKPNRPAPVSGPGALSRRTDSQPTRRIPDAQYGEQSAMQSIQAGAPMEGNALGPGGGASPSPMMPPGGGPPIEVPPFGAPSSRSDEPITAGIDMGAGPGSASLGMLDEKTLQERADKESLIRYLPVLEFLANRPGASASLRNLVRTLKASF